MKQSFLILVLFNTTVMLGGQFYSFAPFVAMSGLALWAVLLSTAWRQLNCWLWIAFLLIVAWELNNIGAISTADNNTHIVIPAQFPFTLYPDDTLTSFSGWLVISSFALAYRERSDYMERIILWLASALAVFGILQYRTGATGFFWMTPYPDTFFSVFGYVNNASTWFMLAAALALYRSWHNLPIAALFMVCISICGCRAMLPVIPLLVLVKLFPRRALWIVGPAILTIAAVTMDEIMRDRWYEWAGYASVLYHHPLFGVGVHGHQVLTMLYAPEYISRQMIHPPMHGDWMLIAVEYGLIGLTLLGILFIRLIRNMRWASVPGIALAALIAHSLIDMPLRCPAVWLLAVVLTVAAQDMTTSAEQSDVDDPKLFGGSFQRVFLS